MSWGDGEFSKKEKSKVQEQEPPKQEPPKQEPQKQEPPKQEPPKQELQKQEPPKQEPPAQNILHALDTVSITKYMEGTDNGTYTVNRYAEGGGNAVPAMQQAAGRRGRPRVYTDEQRRELHKLNNKRFYEKHGGMKAYYAARRAKKRAMAT